MRNLKVKKDIRRDWFGSAPPKKGQLKTLVLKCHLLEEFAMIIAV